MLLLLLQPVQSCHRTRTGGSGLISVMLTGFKSVTKRYAVQGMPTGQSGLRAVGAITSRADVRSLGPSSFRRKSLPIPR